MRILFHATRVVLLLCARTVLITGFFASLAAAWGYYGYQHIACHPMFSSANADCGSVQALAAEHSLALVKLLAPYQTVLQDNQTELTLYVGAAVIGAVAIELVFGVFAVMRRRRARRDLFKGATQVAGTSASGK